MATEDVAWIWSSKRLPLRVYSSKRSAVNRVDGESTTAQTKHVSNQTPLLAHPSLANPPRTVTVTSHRNNI